MIIALFALSLVMILGGTAAVVQGFPYVRLESGLAMVIGGSTAASAGAILLGIGVAVIQMRMLAEALGRSGGPARPDPAEEPQRPRSFHEAIHAPAIGGMAPAAVPTLAAASGAMSLALRETGLHNGSGPETGQKIEPELGAPAPLPSAAGADEPPLPNPLPEESPHPASPEADLFAEPPELAPAPPQEVSAQEPAQEPARSSHQEAAQEPTQEELSLRPALAEADAAAHTEAPAPAPEETPPPNEAPKAKEAIAEETKAEETEPASEALQVVGTYASGGNTYVMFSNGTIEAETPRGRFNFNSLDELKKFVDSGAETPTRGAA